MYKYSVLQFIFNNYDIYKEPEQIDPECEYILITDDYTIKSDRVKVIVEESLNNLPIWERCFSIRYNLFKYCSTDICIYLDGNVQIQNSLKYIYNNFISSCADLGILLHFERSNIIHEYYSWAILRDYPIERSVYILKYLMNEGYNIKYKGLYEAKMRICKNTDINKEIDSLCFNLLKALKYNNDIERLDQTIYSTILNNKFNNLNIYPIFPKELYNSKNFKVNFHHTEKQVNPVEDLPYYYLFNKKLKSY